jgi:autotransporter-associated beta strand protein
MLAANPFSGFADSLKNDVAGIESTLDSTLDAVGSPLKSLPFIGQQLGALDQVKTFIDNAGNKIQSELTTIGQASATTTELQNELFAALGPAGAGLVTAASSIKVTNLNLDSNGIPTSVDVEMWLHKDAAAATGNLTFNLGLPALPFKIVTAGSINATVGFDYDLAVKYASRGTPITFDSTKNLRDFSSNLPADQLDFSVGATLANNASLTADVGILRGTLVPTPGQQNSLSAQVTAQTVDLSGPHNIQLSGSALINLTATLEFSDGGSAFPSISTNVSMNWGDLTDPSTLAFSYGNVSLNIGQYFSSLVGPVLAEIQQYTKPFQGAINALNTPIPGIDAIIPGFSLMTAIGVAAGSSGYGPLEQIVSTAATIANEINGLNISGDNVSMPFGNFDLNGSMIAAAPAALDPTVLSNLADSLSSLSLSDLTTSAQDLISQFGSNIISKIASIPGVAGTPVEGFLDGISQDVAGGGNGAANATIDFPLFDSPSSILNLLFGQDVDLVAFNAGFNASVTSADVPSGSYAGFGITFQAQASAAASLKIGYDTYGIRELLGQLINGNTSNVVGDIADGFYIQGPKGPDASHLTLNGSITVTAGIGGSIGPVSVILGPQGGLFGNVNVTLNDAQPDTAHDGRIRLPELEYEVIHGDIFNASGKITAGLAIVATGSAPIVGSVSVTLLNIATVTIWDSSSVNSSSAASEPPPTITSIGPTTGPTNVNTTVTIYGTNLDNATEVDFYGAPAAIVSQGPDFIVVNAPQVTPRTVDVTVLTPTGTATDPSAFTYVEPPLVGGISPALGPAVGGTLVTIVGFFLDSATEVDFGNTPGFIESNTTNTITVYSPAGAGMENVRVKTAGGSGTSSNQFAYVPPPDITSVTPDTSPLTAGEIITIDGDNFGDANSGIGDVSVQFGGRSNFAPNSDKYFPPQRIGQLFIPAYWQLTVRVPKATAAGTVNLTVTSASHGISASYPFTYVTPPVVTAVDPAGGPLGGTNAVEIFGTDLNGATAVDFGQNAGTIAAIFQTEPPADQWEMVAIAPAGASGTVDVTVTTAGGTSVPPVNALVDPDSYIYTNAPLFHAMNVSSGPLSGGTVVRINGAFLNEVTEVDFGQTAVTTFDKEFNLIVVTSPPGATGTVDVTLVSPGGRTATSAADRFTYTAAPIVTGLSPNSGPYEGGTTVTIAGTSLANATKVDFGTTAATIISDTASQIVAVSPAGALGYTDVTVTTAGGTSGTSPKDEFDYGLVLPEIDQQVTPGAGPAAGGTSVTIVGKNFLGTTEVDFGTTPATSFTVESPTQIVAVSPPHLAGQVAITVVTPPNERSIYSYPDQFVYTTTSSVNGVSPSSGPVAGGTTVTITGANLAGATAVDFGGVAGTIISDTATRIVATSPAGAAGAVDVTVVTPTGPTATSPADHFTYQIPGPVVSSVSPNSGPPAGGTSVTITGSNLSGATAVYFGSTLATALINNANRTITVTSPAGTSGAVDVTVVTAGGSSAVSPQDHFDYGAVPSVSSLFFSLGPANQNGSGYLGQMIFGLNLTGATDVLYGPIDIPISASDVHDEGSGITDIGFFYPPAEGQGTVDVRVLTPNGETPITANDRFTYTAAPTFIPGEGGNGAGPVAGGGTVTLYTWNMENATAVSFGGIPAASFTENSDGVDSTITAVSPPGAPGLVAVTVTSPQGTESLNNTFRYFAIPTVSGISPASGGISGGNTVVINGTGLDNGATQVNFGGVPATSFGSSGGNLQVQAPPGASLGTVDVTVVTYGGTSVISSADQYTYMPPPTVTAITSPVSASGALEGDTEVTITGTGLTNATEVDFGPNPFSYYNSYTRATIVSDSDGQIVAVSPPGYYGYGPVDVTVTTANGTSATSPADQFTYTHAPFITDVGLRNGNGTLPPQGPVAGGSMVRIDGNDLDGATAVNFGQTAATIVGVSPNEIDVTTPPGATGTVDITVTTPNGTTDLSKADQFTYFAVPTVAGISPSSGSVLGGTQVLINGTGLAGATQVNFGQVVATIVGDSDGQIVVTAPPLFNSSSPDVTVTTPGGTSAISSADVFTYMNPPYVNDVAPVSGPVQGGTLVTINGPFLTGAQSVLFGANPGTIISNTGSQIVVLSPEATADAAGTVDVTVVTQYGTSQTSASDQFTYALPPAVSGIVQSSGSAAGGTTVSISGANLSGATAVDFGGVPALSFTVNFDGTITAVSPGGAVSTVDVTVVTPGGTTATSLADQFTYVAVPSVSAIGPFSGPIAGGTQVTIIGTGLSNATEVDFSDQFGDPAVPGAILSNTDGQIVVTSPNGGSAGTVDVTVTTIGGTSAISTADQFTYVAAPSVSHISPSFGFRSGGDLVTITGANLDNATAVDFGQNAGTIVDETATQIDVSSPAGAAGVVDLTVVTPGGTSAPSAQDKFTYIVPPPFILGVTPSIGPAPSAVTITGTDLDGATEVDFNDAFGNAFVGTIVSDTATQIVVTSPANIVGTVDVTVTTPAGTSGVSPVDQFTSTPFPAVSSVDASIGPTAGGTEVFIYGTNLDGATAVKFGQTAATVVDDAATYIIAISPPGAAGMVDLTVTTQYGTTAISPADRFTYFGPPTANADSYTTTQGSTLTVAAPGVLANDTGPQGYPLTADQLTDPTHGTLSFGSDGSFIYAPGAGYLGPDSFTYQVSDGIDSSAAATVSLTVGLATLTWTGTSNRNWTDPQWSGSGLSYPDSTANAIVDTAVSVVQVTSAQAANGLAISNGGQVAVGPGASLSVTTDTSVTAGGAINVDPNGVFSTGGTLTLDTGGSLTGGAVAASNYQFNDGVAGANLSGPGGLTKNTNGTVQLLGTNSYAGGTAINGGTLIVASGGALPVGTNLTIGPNGMGELASGVNQIVGGIDGMGNLQCDSSSSLTANHITLVSLVIGGTADAPARVTIAASDASGNPLDLAHGGPSAGAATAAVTSNSTSGSSASPTSVAVAPSTHLFSGSALAVQTNSSDSAGLIAVQSSREIIAVSGLAISADNETKWSSSFTTTDESLTSDSATSGNRQVLIVANGNGGLLHRDAVAAAFAVADVLEWTASSPASRPSAADADICLMADDLLEVIGRHWRN